MSLRRAASLEVEQGVVSSYVHGAVIDGAGKMGVLVALESTGKTDELAVLGRQLAMHVAATNPQALDPSGLDPEVVKREKDVLADKYRQQGKPENVIEKIVESGLKTYYKEVCLLEQAFIHDTGKSVAQAVKEAEGKVGGACEDCRLCALCSRRGNRKAGIRFRGRGRGRQRQEVTAAVIALPARVAPEADLRGIRKRLAMAGPVYRRVVIKLSGEYLAGSAGLRHRPAHR